MVSLNSCGAIFEFDFKRYLFAFFFSLAIAVIGVIIMMIRGNNKNK